MNWNDSVSTSIGFYTSGYDIFLQINIRSLN